MLGRERRVAYGRRMAGEPNDDAGPVRIPITGELDLHTFRPQDTAELLEAYFGQSEPVHAVAARGGAGRK